MSRPGVVDRRRDPTGRGGLKVEPGDAPEGWGRQLVDRLAGTHAVQPYDVAVGVVDLRAVAMRRSELVRLNVPVRERARAVAIRFMQMLGRKRRRQGEPRRQNEADDEPAERMRHPSQLW